MGKSLLRDDTLSVWHMDFAFVFLCPIIIALPISYIPWATQYNFFLLSCEISFFGLNLWNK